LRISCSVKQIVFIFILFFFTSLLFGVNPLFAQTTDTTIQTSLVKHSSKTVNNSIQAIKERQPAKIDSEVIVSQISAADSVLKRQQLIQDSLLLQKQADSLAVVEVQEKEKVYFAWLNGVLSENRFFKNVDLPIAEPDIVRPSHTNGVLFYLVTGVLFLLALVRVSFSKYFSDLFRAFFNPTLSSRQLKDQLLQTPLPSLLLNIFFCISTGVYLFLLLRYFKFIVSYKMFVVILAMVLLIGGIYLFKYILLLISGWIFGSKELVEAYIFILFLINKITGILLLPFIIVLAFCSYPIAEVGFYLSLSILLGLIIYRYIRSYGLIKNYISLNNFHFFLYLCAFEIAPVLIVAKVILIWLNGNT
jgi:Domain of unknown function (DUF4271)